MYYYSMKKNTVSAGGIRSKPLCRTDIETKEIRCMVEAVLSDLFTFSDGDNFSVRAAADESGITLSSPDTARSIYIEIPFTADALRAAAYELMSRDSNLRFTCDKTTCSVFLGENSVKLTPTEFRLFSAILENGNKFASAEELSVPVWGTCNCNLCTVYLSYLRRKLDFAFGEGCLICVRGKGYRLRGTDN